jgi:hypothetical protein
LESRLLLAGDPTGTWLGQDGHDLVGPSSALGPSGIQDIHIAVSNLPSDRTVVFADVQGLGGGDWQYNGTTNAWAADFVHAPGTTSADLYVEPYQADSGRPYSVSLHYDDGSVAGFWVSGGAVDPNLRMPQDQLQVAWPGQDGHDLVGTGPDVGPNGLQDLHLALTGLTPGVAVSSASLTSLDGSQWAFGTNSQAIDNAELIRHADDSTKGDFYVQPKSDLSGQTLILTVNYANGSSNSATFTAGGSTQANLPDPQAPALPAIRTGLTAQWLGQDGLNLTGPGDVHIALAGLPGDHAVVGATLSDQVQADWAYRKESQTSYYIDSFVPSMGFRSSPSDVTRADISFPPVRDETGATLTLRLQFDDGSMAVVTLPGGASDPGLRGPNIAVTSVVAHPGNDLNDLANNYGTVHLSAGTYALSAPLVLNSPVTITADPGTTLLFSQSASDAPWTAAILIHASHTTLNGFAVRFSGPVNWNWNVQYGPAVIGTSDNLNPGTGDPKFALALTNLDVQSPPAATALEPAPDLMRVITASSGLVAGNTLKGGTTEVRGGPWHVVNNNYLGTVPGTTTSAAFAGHYTHDLLLQGNTAAPQGPSGKTWRFLVLTNNGANDVVAGNKVVGIGPQDNDTVPNPNATEIILTEAYSLHFEGTPSAISADGRILQIPSPQGLPAQTGDVVAILTGPDAGQWRRIAQAIDPNTYLMDSPLPQGGYAISIASGFVGETFQNNTVDARGSSIAVDLALLGDHFGTRVIGNDLLGGGAAFEFSAAATEFPDIWGWSHAPFLGATVAGNTIEDALHGGSLVVAHGAPVKTDAGRVYFSGQLDDTTVRWTSGFLTQHPNPTALTVGDPGSLDPGELVLGMSGNVIQAAPGQHPQGNTVTVNGGVVNGLGMLGAGLMLPYSVPGAPTGLCLVNDSGISATDHLTNDARLKFDPAPGAAGYEYRVGTSGTYQSGASPAGFLPPGLVKGSNVVSVRAVDPVGNRGPEATISFVLDTVAPEASPPVLAPTSDSGRSYSDGITNVRSPQFLVSGAASDTIVLLRGGVDLARRVGPGTLSEPTALSDGTYSYSLRRSDAAGNVSLSPAISVLIDTTPPISALPALAPGSDSGWSNSDGITNVTSPQFIVAGASDDLITLLRNGTAVAQRLGAGILQEPTKLADGTYLYVLQRADVAGNVSTSTPISVVTETVPPPTVGNLSVLKGNIVQFQPISSNDTYQYRVGQGPYLPVYSTTFLPAGLAPGVNAVWVRAVDMAGNAGPAKPVLVNTNPAVLSAAWLGQDGHDLVGPYPVQVPDGIQDVRFALAGLKPFRAITSIVVQGLGGGEWVYNGPYGPWKAALVRSPRSTTADLYIQPYQFETGRPYSINIKYDDSSGATIWVGGGPVDPTLRALTPLPAGTIGAARGANSRAAKSPKRGSHPTGKVHSAAIVLSSTWKRAGLGRSEQHKG